MKKPWERQESRLAKTFKGERQPRSGAGWSRKHDVRNQELLIEAKQTEHLSYQLKLHTLRHLAHTADRESRVPVLAVEIAGHHYVVLREADFHAYQGDAGEATTAPRDP